MAQLEHDTLSVYCPACNEEFLGGLEDSACPRCGMSAAFDDHSSLQTVIWSGAGKKRRQETERPESLNHLIGAVIDCYEIESFIGKGGMGWVFLARHLRLGRMCALKILCPSLVESDPDYLDRFCTEGQAAASLNHPNVVTIHAIGHYRDLHFIEMEFVPGRPLQKVVSERSLPTIRAAALALGISNGLAAAHRKGIIHRDLKPDNILLTHDGVPKLGDFGLAKRLHGRHRLEFANALAGTPHFMAPELFGGGEASPASDVYALGVTLYAMLAGQLPFPKKNWNDLVSAVMNEAPPSLRKLRADIPLEWAECASMMLEKSPSNRPRDGIEAAQLLRAVLGHTEDLESLMHAAFGDEQHVSWTSHGTQCMAVVDLANGRKQKVCLETRGIDLEDRVLQIYSQCCPAESHFYGDALRLNAQIAHGAIALREVNGQEHFVIMNAYPRSTVDAEEIRRSVLDIAMHADAVEHQLTNDDVH